MTSYKLLTSAALLCLLTLSSCKKEYNCYCTNGNSYTLKKKKKKDAIIACTNHADQGPYVLWLCTLDE